MPDITQQPHNLEAEQAVLGSMLLDVAALSMGVDRLASDDFYSRLHQEVFLAMQALHARGQPADQVTVAEELEKRGSLDGVGLPYLMELPMQVPTTVNVSAHIEIVEEKSMLRRLSQAGRGIQEDANDAGLPLADQLNKAERSIFEISQRKHHRGITHIQPVLVSSYARIEDAFLNKGQIQGVTTGFADLDRKLSGLNKSDLILMGARPSMGKTAIMLNIAYAAAIKGNQPVAVFDLEMSNEQLTNRLLSSAAGVDLSKLRSGELDENDFGRLAGAMGELSRAPIYMDDTPGITVPEIRSKCRRMKLEHGLGLIIIDYLQLMSSPSNGRRSDNRQQEVSDITRSLKLLARELDVPVLVGSQLSRATETRSEANHRPQLSDLRESGAIEQDADVVMFLYRDYVYSKDETKRGEAEIIIAKQRNGPTGTVNLVWLEQFTRFVDAAASYTPKEY